MDFVHFIFFVRPTAVKLAAVRIHGVLWCPMHAVRTL